MTENELAEFYMHLETKNAELRALVGELVEYLVAYHVYLEMTGQNASGSVMTDLRETIAKAKEQVK